MEESKVTIAFIRIAEETIRLEGTYDAKEVPSLQLRAGKTVYLNASQETERFPSERTPFSFTVPVPEKGKTLLQFLRDDGEVCDVVYGKFSPVQERYRHSYYWTDGVAVTYAENVLYVEHATRRAPYERKLLAEMLFHGGGRGKKDFILRCAKRMLPSRKDVWVITDRPDRAGDNGEALFRYVNEQKSGHAYFAITKDSPDYRRLKQYGRVISYSRLRYKLLYLSGAVMISSQGEDSHYRPYLGNTVAFADLAQDTISVFLQHGVTKDDISDWLNRYNRNFSLFICGTQPEYASILQGAYGYGKEQVALTGFPRHDRLESAPQKVVSVMLTWRNYLVESQDAVGRRGIKPKFKESRYYRMHQVLMTDPQLHKCLSEQGYRMQVILHPAISQAEQEIQALCPECEVLARADYRQVFRMSDVIVTDYSSVAFDFAMLRKPILYWQEDRDEFFAGEHVYTKGYFDYERDGFGDVVYTAEECVSRLCDIIKSGCILEEKYARRINTTFPYGTEGNCARVCEAIRQVSEQGITDRNTKGL